jgi:hypothetical protein
MRVLLVEYEAALAEVIVGAGQALFHHQAQGRLTASSAGLDFNIPERAARAQLPRVSRAPSLPKTQVAALVRSHVTGHDLGMFGEHRVSVLQLNLALNEQLGATQQRGTSR